MKLLVIGRPGRLEKYSPDTELYRNTEVVRVMPGTPDEEILKVAADAEMILVCLLYTSPSPRDTR